MHEQDPPPYNRVYGPVYPRGGAAGVLFHRDELIAQWGDIHRSDLTFSVARTYLALLAGLAVDTGLLPDVHERVIERRAPSRRSTAIWSGSTRPNRFFRPRRTALGLRSRRFVGHVDRCGTRIVCVLRWIDSGKIDECVARIMGAVDR